MIDLSRLRICWLAGTLGQGGAERQLFYFAQALRQSGARVRVLALDRGAFWEQPLKNAGATVTWIGEDRSRLKRLFKMAKLLKAERADVLQAQHFYTNAYAALAAWLVNCKGIGAIRSSGRFDVSDSGRIGGRINLHLPRILVGNSKNAIGYAIRNGVPAARLYFLPNAVDTEQFKPAAPPTTRPITLLAVGRLSREKRLDRFLTILHRIRKEHHFNVRGLIAGSQRGQRDLRPQLEHQAARLGLLPEGVQFLGSVSDMPALYKQASICVLTSDHEGTPNVLLEAMAAGLPVVATDVGGVADIVTHGQTGFVTASEDLQAQEDAIVTLLRNPDLSTEMGVRGRAYVEAHHSLNQLTARLSELYELIFSTNTTTDHKSTTAPLWASIPKTRAASRIGCRIQSTTTKS